MTVDKRGHESLGRLSELDMPPLQYYELVANINLLLQQELGNQLSKLSNNLNVAITLATPGSDGRLEAGSQASPTRRLL